jgi:hypothetical protein
VDDERGSQRFEVELTERVPARARRSRRRDGGRRSEPAGPGPADAVAPEPSARAWAPTDAPGSRPTYEHPADAPPPGAVLVTAEPDLSGPFGSERSRLVVTGVAVGLVALLLGWVVGRSAGDESATVTDAASTTAAPTTTVASTLLPGDTVPEASVPRAAAGPTTSRPPRTTTTTLPPTWRDAVVAVDPRLAGADDRIVAVTGDRELLELDVATGALRLLEVPAWRSRQVPYSPIAGDDFVVVRFDDNSDITVLRGDDPVPQQLYVDDPWSTFWDVSAGTVWTIDVRSSGFGRPSALVELDLEGEPTGASIDLNGLWPAGVSDPRGGVIVGDGAIGMFTVTPEGSERLAGGRILAIGVEQVLTFDCAETIDDCGVRLVDRSDGSSQPVPVQDAELVDRMLYGWYGGPTTTAQITSDGAHAIVPVWSEFGPPVATVINTRTGAVTRLDSGDEVPGITLYPSAVWSDDERFAYHVDGGVVTAWDRSTGERFAVSDGLPPVRSLSVRAGS